MSNRRRPRFDGALYELLRRLVRCPDCRSIVRLAGDTVNVFHDNSCPRLAGHTGRCAPIAYVIVPTGGR